jgi:hypothetical protein
VQLLSSVLEATLRRDIDFSADVVAVLSAALQLLLDKVTALVDAGPLDQAAVRKKGRTC